MNTPSLVEMVRTASPDTLAAVQLRHPAAPEVFQTTRLLGDGDASFSPEKRAATLDFLGTSLNVAAKQLDQLSAAIRLTMRKVSGIRFFGSLVATIAGGFAGLAALAFPNDVVQAGGAFLAMVGGIASATADQFEKAPSGIRIASTDEYAKLIEARSDLELFRLKITGDPIFPISDADLAAIGNRLDQISVSIIRLKMA